MKRFPVKNNYIAPVVTEAPPTPAGAFDVEKLLNNCGEILRREVANLLMESSGAKLSPTSARDLTQYVKLLTELKREQAADLASMTDEQLAELVKQS